MKVIDSETRMEICPGDRITSRAGRTYTYQGIHMPPKPIGYSGDPFLGRINATDDDGNLVYPQPHPYDFGLIIVESD